MSGNDCFTSLYDKDCNGKSCDSSLSVSKQDRYTGKEPSKYYCSHSENFSSDEKYRGHENHCRTNWHTQNRKRPSLDRGYREVAFKKYPLTSNGNSVPEVIDLVEDEESNEPYCITLWNSPKRPKSDTISEQHKSGDNYDVHKNEQFTPISDHLKSSLHSHRKVLQQFVENAVEKTKFLKTERCDSIITVYDVEEEEKIKPVFYKEERQHNYSDTSNIIAEVNTNDKIMGTISQQTLELPKTNFEKNSDNIVSPLSFETKIVPVHYDSDKKSNKSTISVSNNTEADDIIYEKTIKNEKNVTSEQIDEFTNDNLYNSVYKQSDKISCNEDKSATTVNVQFNVIAVSDNILSNINPIVILQKIDLKEKYNVLNSNCKLESCDAHSNANDARKMSEGEKSNTKIDSKELNYKLTNNVNNVSNSRISYLIDSFDNSHTEVEKFSKNPVKHLKSVLLLLNEKLNNKCRISLVNDVHDPSKLSKALFCFESNNETSNITECSLSEVKYLDFKEYDPIPNINYKMLSCYEFNIKRYYNIYTEYKKLLFNEVNKTIKDFTIYSNLDLNHSAFKNQNIDVIPGSKPNSYKLVVNKNSELYRSLLKTALIIPNLAESLAKHITTKATLKLKGLIRKYHMALIHENIIKPKLKLQNGKKMFVGTFHYNFIKGHDLSPPAEELRRYLQNKLNCPISENMKLNLTAHFGRDFILYKDPRLSQLDKLATELVTIISSSITMPKEKILFRKYASLKDDILKIVGHILEKGDNDTVIFTKKFLDLNTKLPGNLNHLRDIIKGKLKEKDISFSKISDCKFKMNEFRDKEASHVMKKLPRETENINIQEFFDKLEFVVNQVDVDSKICTEIGDEFKLVKDESYAIAVQDELLTWLRTKNYSLDPFPLIKTRISKFIIQNRSLSNINVYGEIKIRFRQEFLNEIIQCLNNSDIEVIYLETDSILLSEHKIHQIIESIPKYSENHNCLFINIDMLITESYHVLTAFESPSTNLLVIKCSRHITNIDNGTDIFHKLKNIIDRSSENKKKLIFIGNVKNILENTKFNSKLIIDTHNILENATEDSQNELLENINVQLYHRRVKLLEIMDKKAMLKLIKSSDLLTQLLCETLIIGNEFIVPSGFDNDSYIPKRIIQHVVIKSEIFKKKIDDVFVITGIEKMDFCEFVTPDEKVCYIHEADSYMQIDARFILADHAYDKLSFEKFTMKKKGNFHLLEYESKKFVWQKSKGCISGLLDYRDEDPNVLREYKLSNGSVESPGIDGNTKTTIIAGDFGSGKSVYLYDLARRSCTNFDFPLWVVQVNLNNTTFDKCINQVVNDEMSAIETILMFLRFDNLRIRLFMMCALNMLKLRMIILFDGFDELPTNQMDFLTNLLKHLQSSSISNIYVTVRSNSSVKLEKALGYFSYSLENFSHDENLDFLVMHWTKKLQAYGQVDKLRECARNLLTAYNETSTLTSSPLQLKMLAEIHRMSIERTEGSDFTIFHLQNYYELYKHFISSLNVDSSCDEVSLQKSSLKRLLDSSDFKRLGLEDDFQNQDIPEFDHVTFAEYFAARWLVNHSNSEVLQCIALNCMDDLVVRTSPVFLESLAALFCLNNRKTLRSFVSFLAESGYVNLLEVLLRHTSYDDTETEKTILHTAAKSNKAQVVKILLRHWNHLQKRDLRNHRCAQLLFEYANYKLVAYVNKIYEGQSALQLAASNDNVAIACDLILAGADVTLVDNDFLRLLVKYVLNAISVESDGSRELWPLAEKLLTIVPEEIQQLKTEIEYSKLLNYFFVRGRVRIITTLFRVLGNKINKHKFMTTKVDGATLLDQVNNSPFVKDDERLEISKLVIKEICAHPNKNDSYPRSILQAAVRFEHGKTFEYFIDQYPGGHVGFLKHALQSNRTQILEFLARNNERTIDPITGNTALQTAVNLGVSPRMIKFLVDKGGINSTNNSGENVLCVAIKAGADLKVIEYLVEQGADANAEDRIGFFPWCYAVIAETSRYTNEQQLSLMRYLLSGTRGKISVPVARCKSYSYDKWREELAKKFEFFRDPDGYDPNYERYEGKVRSLRLHSAVESNDLVWCNFLIDRGADIDIRDDRGRAPLHVAVEFGRYEAARLLLRNGAAFDLEDENFRTPLEMLGHANHRIEEGTKLRTLLKKARRCFSSAKLTMLLQKHLPVERRDLDESPVRCLVGCRDKRGRSLLHVAADTSSADAFRRLTKFGLACAERYPNFRGLDPSLRDRDGDTPMHLAARKGYRGFLAYLASEGACFEAKNLAGETPADLARAHVFLKAEELLGTARNLLEAARNSDSKSLESCLAEEPRLINARDACGRMALHLASVSRDGNQPSALTKCILLDGRCNIDAADFSGRTPLHYAVEADNIESAKVLLKAGSMIDAKDAQGLRPFDLRGGSNESVEMLKAIHRLIVDVQSPEPKIVLNEQPKIFVDYVTNVSRSYGVDRDIVVNTRECNRNTLMHFAVKFDYVEIVEALLRNGAVYNPRNKLKRKPVDFAKSTKELLDSVDGMFGNVNVNSWRSSQVDSEIVVGCRGTGGYTLLHVAAKSGKTEEVNWLIKRGADPNVSNNKGSIALTYADKNYPAVAKIMRKL